MLHIYFMIEFMRVPLRMIGCVCVYWCVCADDDDVDDDDDDDLMMTIMMMMKCDGDEYHDNYDGFGFICSLIYVRLRSGLECASAHYRKHSSVTFLSASCENQELGVRSRAIIPDGRLSSSSDFNSSTPAKNARLGLPGLPWCASEGASSPYLQVDLGSLRAVCAIATQGNSHADQWVGAYQLQTSPNGATWTYYSERGQSRVSFTALPGSGFSKR